MVKSLLVWAAAAVSVCQATPILSPPLVRAVTSGYGDVVVFSTTVDDDASAHAVAKRSDTTFDLTSNFNNDEIFDGTWVENIDGITETISLSLTCVECYTKGTVTASVVDAPNVRLRLDFEDVAGHFDFELAASSSATYTYTIYSTDTPAGVSFNTGVVDVSLGLVLYLDLVFTLSAEVDLEGGFTVQIPNGSYIEAYILDGVIADASFDGTALQAIPVTLNSGNATFKADLRLRVECGADAEVLGLGVDAELGVYANLLEFIGTAAYTEDCDVLFVETWDINAGAYLDLDVVIDYSTFGAIPTVSSTFYIGASASQCVNFGGSAATAVSASASSTAYGYGPLSAAISTARTATATTSSVSTAASVYESASSVVSGYASSIPTYTYSNGSVAVAAAAVVSGTVVSGVAASGTVVSGVVAYGTAVSALAGANSTSTVYATSTYTITSCAASVVNCPASMQTQIVVTKVITDYTTVCPVTAAAASASAVFASASSVFAAVAASSSAASAASIASSASSVSAAASEATMVVITDVYVGSACETPIVATYTPAASVRSVSISVVSGSAASASSVSSSASSAKAVASAFFYGNGTAAYFTGATGATGATAASTAAASAIVVNLEVSSASNATKSTGSVVSSTAKTSSTKTAATAAVTGGAGHAMAGNSAMAMAAVLAAVVVLI